MVISVNGARTSSTSEDGCEIFNCSEYEKDMVVMWVRTDL